MRFGNRYEAVNEIGSPPAAKISVKNMVTNAAQTAWISSGSFRYPYESFKISEDYSVVMTIPEVQKFSSDIDILTQEGERISTVLEVNKPFKYKGWKICPLVCYDLRFPVWARNAEDYDLLIYVANWPKPRINAWDTLLKARAIENMCYTIGVNRIGEDANKLEYPGHSKAIDFLGNTIVDCEDELGVFIFELDKNAQQETRQKLNFLNDRDDFTII